MANNFQEPRSLAAARDRLEAAERKVKRYEAAKEQDELAADTAWSKVLTGTSGVLSAVGSGMIFEAFPRLKSFDKGGRIGTRPVIALGSLLGATFLPGGFGDAAEGMTYGVGLPFFSDQGANAVRWLRR